jgi:hypothetical protein
MSWAVLSRVVRKCWHLTQGLRFTLYWLNFSRILHGRARVTFRLAQTTCEVSAWKGYLAFPPVGPSLLLPNTPNCADETFRWSGGALDSAQAAV